MLSKRTTRIIVLLIAVELVLVGAILLVQQQKILGWIGSVNLGSTSTSSGAIANRGEPTPKRTTEGSGGSSLEMSTPTPVALTETPTSFPQQGEPDVSVSQVPTLPPISVSSPSPTPPQPRVVSAPSNPRPVLPSGPSAMSSRIVIGAIGVDSPVVEMGYTFREENGQEVADWQVPEEAVGHMVGSANPGAQGNVVLSGHNNILGAVFKKLYTLKKGDELTLFNKAGNGYVYRVFQSYIVQELGASPEQRVANAQVLLPTADARVTLISCWPETDNSDRAIVIAQLVGYVR